MKELEGVDRLRNETMIGKDIMFTILARISLQDVSFSESLYIFVVANVFV